MAKLLAVAAAATAGADKCLKLHMTAAERAGANKEEILDAVFMAGIIGQTKVLAAALRTFQEFEDALKDAGQTKLEFGNDNCR